MSASVDLRSLSSWSWAGQFFGNLGDDLEEHSNDSGSEVSDDEESYSSYTTASSSDGFVFHRDYTILAPSKTFDEMSDIYDSVATELSHSGSTLNSKGTSGSEQEQQQQQRRFRRRSTASASIKSSSQRTVPPLLKAITEEDDDTDAHEAFLRAKMTSLWTRIQESAQAEDLSAAPTTEQDKALLRAYAIKNDTLTLLSNTP
ncbi:expressed unknown protein [Seminavis robusta]|uniref:Uncharacterized protein n=1 Tax=Seminavis robusta TaxID=568900 RepID=A0A9N8DI78_9STRA|nr:expressed unknown protein [Seminavis robusta]|eukprot:Sro166_g074110.1 n/a (202) ;mRNA; r:31302-31907